MSTKSEHLPQDVGRKDSPGCAIALISLTASAVGTIFGSIFYVLKNGQGDIGALVIAPLIALVGGVFAIPIGIVVGCLSLWIGGRAIAASPMLGSLALGLLGLVLGGVAGELLDSRGIESAPYVFGSIIGSLHGIFWSSRVGVARLRVLAASLACATLIPGMVVLAEDGWNLRESEQKFNEYCSGREANLATVINPGQRKLASDRRLNDGKWYNQRRWRSLYRRSDVIDLPEGRRLLATDFAYVPQGIFAALTGGKRVSRHCLSEAQSPDARFARQHGAGRRPTLADLED